MRGWRIKGGNRSLIRGSFNLREYTHAHTLAHTHTHANTQIYRNTHKGVTGVT